MTSPTYLKLLHSMTKAERARFYRFTSTLGRVSALTDRERITLIQLVKMGRTVIRREDVT